MSTNIAHRIYFRGELTDSYHSHRLSDSVPHKTSESPAEKRATGRRRVASMPAFESLESFMAAMSGSAKKEERASCKPVNAVLVNMQIQAKKPESATKGLLVHPFRPDESTKIPCTAGFANAHINPDRHAHTTAAHTPHASRIRNFWKCEHGRRGDTCRLCVGDEEAERIRALERQERQARQQMEGAAKSIKTEDHCQAKSIASAAKNIKIERTQERKQESKAAAAAAGGEEEKVEKRSKNGERANKMREEGQGCEGHKRDEVVHESVTRGMKSMTLPEPTSSKVDSEVSSEEEEKEEEEEDALDKKKGVKDQSRENRKKENVDTERPSGYTVSDKPNEFASEAQQLPEALGKMWKMRPAVQACKELLQVRKDTAHVFFLALLFFFLALLFF